MTRTYYQKPGSDKWYIDKDADAQLDYIFEWLNWLNEHDPDDVLQTHTIIADAGLTVISSGINGSKVVAWIKGGELGLVYKVTCRIQTANTPNRIEDQSIYIKIVDR